MKKFWLENLESGVKKPLKFTDEKAALEFIRPIYNAMASDDDTPSEWLMMRDLMDGEDYVLVPGGPGGGDDEFTWVPREV